MATTSIRNPLPLRTATSLSMKRSLIAKDLRVRIRALKGSEVTPQLWLSVWPHPNSLCNTSPDKVVKQAPELYLLICCRGFLLPSLPSTFSVMEAFLPAEFYPVLESRSPFHKLGAESHVHLERNVAIVATWWLRIYIWFVCFPRRMFFLSWTFLMTS